jgi:murein DD-endopeptidase MepM/ murein hydrolase activator NlpD
MSNWKVNLSNLTGNTTAKFIPQMKKVAITAIAVTALSISIYSAPSAKESDTEKVYYVYYNNDYMGTVSDKKVVETVVKNKVKEMERKYTGLELSAGSQITYIPEQVFGSSSKTNNERVVKELAKQMNVQAVATAIEVDGQQVAFVQNKQNADEVIKKLKLAYVNEEQLNAVEAMQKDPNLAQAPLQEGETRITKVDLSKNVSFSTANIAPEQIMAVDNAVQFLKNGTLEQKKYQVQEGEVLGSVANNHGLTLAQIIELNPGLTEESVLQIGQEVNITVLQPFINVLVEKQSYVKETLAFASERVQDANMPKGEKAVRQQGQNGERLATYTISEVNGQSVSKQEINANVTKPVVNEIVAIGTKAIPSRGDGSLAWPTVGGYVSSPMGYRGGKMHKGMDIARPSAYTIKAADNGVVVSAGYDGGYGNKIVIDHQNGIRTVYAHLSSIGVSVGQTVSKGTGIGVMGSTGNSSGVHLHFEVYKNGSLQNPAGFLR